MKRLFFTISIFSLSLTGFCQTPDYSNLSKSKKLRFLNYFGYIKTVEGDTIYGVLDGISNGKLQMKYPKELKMYESKEAFDLEEIDSYLQGIPNNGFPKQYRFIRKIEEEYQVVAKIIEGYITVYRKDDLNSMGFNTGGGSSYNTESITYYYYLQKDEEPITFVFKSTNNKSDIESNLSNYLGVQISNKKKIKEEELISIIEEFNKNKGI